MKEHKLSCLVLICLFAASLNVLAKNNSVQNNVEFEWEEMLGATEYQVELEHPKTNKVLTFNSKNSHFNLPIMPGIYTIKGRVSDDRGVFGEWSQPEKFNVPPRPPQIDQKKISSEISVDKKSFTANAPIQWTKSLGADEYKVQILDDKNKAIKQLITKDETANLQLRPGTYRVRISSLTSDGIESEAFDLPNLIRINNIPIQKPENTILDLKLKQLKIPQTEGLMSVIQIEVQKFLGQTWTKIDSFDVPTDIWQIPTNLTPGKYRISIYYKNSFNESSESAIQNFVVKPTEELLK